MSQYLGRGAVSRGRMTITPGLSTVVSEAPYLRDENDVEAVIKGIENLQEALAGVEGLEFARPAPNVTARQFVEDVSSPCFPLCTAIAITLTPLRLDGCFAVEPPGEPLDR